MCKKNHHILSIFYIKTPMNIVSGEQFGLIFLYELKLGHNASQDEKNLNITFMNESCNHQTTISPKISIW